MDGCELRVSADSAEADQFRNVTDPRLLDDVNPDVNPHEGIVPEKRAGVHPVGSDACHFRREVDYSSWSALS
jgi:hypothetical protein